MILLCDTNIFLQTNIPSHLTLIAFFQDTRKFFLGLDRTQVIEQEYLSRGSGNRYLQNIILRLQRERLLRTADQLSGELSPDDLQRLNIFVSSYDSISNVEITMLAIALANPGVTLVCVDPQTASLPVNRQLLVPDRIPDLQKGLGIKIKSCDEIVNDLRMAPEGAPRDIASLESFLDSASRREHDYLEFKQPRNGLVARMCRDITKAVCAMLNSTTGFVMVGIDETVNAQVKGFEKTFESHPKKVDELEIRLVNDYLRKIEPKPDCFVRLWSIDKDASRIVMIVFVEKGSREYRYCFDDRGLLAFRRVGTQSCSNSQTT